MARGSFTAESGRRRAGVSLTALDAGDPAKAAALRALADSPGSGAMADLAAESGRWPGAPPRFANASFATAMDGRTVRIAQSVWFGSPSTPDDPELARMTAAALAIPLPR
jgi:hypothetical protein